MRKGRGGRQRERGGFAVERRDVGVCGGGGCVDKRWVFLWGKGKEMPAAERLGFWRRGWKLRNCECVSGH